MPDAYARKRDFATTPEPKGGARPRPGRAAGEPRFVIQEHSATRLHWDLRLEHDGALASWALPNGLPETPKLNRLAVRTEDHPLEYLDFHGEIPNGNYGAGTMKIWDHGTYEPLKWEPRKVEVALHGERISGRYALFPLDKGDGAKDWMIHRMDAPADAAREPMPDRIAPMLARSGELPALRGAAAQQWAHEIKWDGVRCVAFNAPGRLRLQARSLNEITAQYPELARLSRELGSHEAILDGEIVVLDDRGRPDFGALQRRMHVTGDAQTRRLARQTPVTYVIFDLLWLDGHSLAELSYRERRERLAALGLDGGERWRVPDYVVGRGPELLAASAEQELEGIVAKRLDSPYTPGRRSPTWVKVKNVHRQEVVIGGWMPGQGGRSQRIGALLAGVRDDDGTLRYAGRVGSGFTDAELDRLAAVLAPLHRDRSPFGSGAAPPRGSRFVEPELVCEVQFAHWTASGSMRAPVYKGLRVDKEPALVVREESAKAALLQVGGHDVRLANPSKVLWPAAGFTKRDLVDYLVAIAPVALPHLADRQLTLKRYPDGVDGQHFYEKNAPGHRPDWVRTAQGFVVADDVATLAWLGNLADIEWHTSLARVGELGRPTVVAFDLDPGPGATIVECSHVARLIRGMLDGLGLRCWAKTSGSKGMQVYVPLNTPVTHAHTKSFARAVAQTLEQAEPALVTSRMTKVLRAGRVLIDWSQNDAHKTTVCVYSPRAMERPTVSTPVAWDEVEACARTGDPDTLVFDTAAVLARVERDGDLFADVVSGTQTLPEM